MAVFAAKAACFVNNAKWLVLSVALAVTFAAIIGAGTITVSTKLEALMPEGAASVQTLHDAMTKAGSFASIQVVIEGKDKAKIKEALFVLEAIARHLPWSESAQYYEDIAVLEQHKLLQLDVDELSELERELEREMVATTARSFKDSTGISLNINLLESGITVSSDAKNKHETSRQKSKADLLAPIETKRQFSSDDGNAQALIIWPKPGYEGLSEAKAMIDDIAAIIVALDLNAPEDGLKVGVAGRVRNKVAQFDAVMNDVVIGLGCSITFIMILLAFAYRKIAAIPLIILPLVLGIIWTIGLTSIAIGSLNLITIFLALILFGLGVDFGIHNLSRYAEVRANGNNHLEALEVIMGHTGRASLAAGLTTAAGFFVLMLTEFRAFREFGFIAGSGIVLIYISMYSVFPAVLSVTERWVNWYRMANISRSTTNTHAMRLTGFGRPKITLTLLLCFIFGGAVLIPNLQFEKNFRNIQSPQTAGHAWATSVSKNIFKGGHDRAVLVVDTLEEVEAIEAYFAAYTAEDTVTPTISRVTSLRNFVPNPETQTARLAVINRMWEKLEKGAPIPDELSDKTEYLKIGMLTTDVLPDGLRRIYLGDETLPGYLMYFYNSVTMDDADLARMFYDDVAEFTVNGKTYYPASEAFIFVEMLDLMKSDAILAVSLVSIITVIMVLFAVRSRLTAAIILLPTVALMVLTLAAMSIFALPLSIINMVILPSLVGISVDNSIHIVERFRETNADILDIMKTTGRAATVTTLTTLLGFGGLVTASMGGLQSMGALALIGFTICLFLTWTLLPSLLQIFGHRLRREKLLKFTKAH